MKKFTYILTIVDFLSTTMQLLGINLSVLAAVARADCSFSIKF